MHYPILDEFIKDISASENPVLAKLGADISQGAQNQNQAPDPVNDQAKEQEAVDPMVHDKPNPNQAPGEKQPDVVDVLLGKPMPEIEIQEQQEKKQETFGKSASLWDYLVQQTQKKSEDQKPNA